MTPVIYPIRSTPDTLLVFVAKPPEKSPVPQVAADARPYIIACSSEFSIRVESVCPLELIKIGDLLRISKGGYVIREI
jgi:hypothetical protein